MPDQLFEHFELDVFPPPAYEVRRLGDRRRRRTAAAVAVGAAAVVIAAVTPIALLSGSHDSSNPLPSQHDTQTSTQVPYPWRVFVPGSFDLTAGMATSPAPHQAMVESGSPGAGDAAEEVDVCGAPVWQASDGVQTVAASWTDGVEGVEHRTLSTYPSDFAAEAAITAIGTAVRGCPGIQGTRRAQLGEPIGTELAWADPAVAGSGADGTGTAYVVTVLNNILVIDRANMTSVGDVQALTQTFENLFAKLQPALTAAYSMFPGMDTSNPNADLGDVPADLRLKVSPLPVGRGWSGNGPDANVTGIPPLRMCGRLAWNAPAVGHLGWRSWGSSDVEVRDVREYVDDANAEHELTVLDQAATACPSETHGGTTTWSVVQRSKDSVALTSTYAAAPGRTSYLFTRVGRAVVGFAYTAAMAPGEALSRLTAASDKIAPGLCGLTSDGCPSS